MLLLPLPLLLLLLLRAKVTEWATLPGSEGAAALPEVDAGASRALEVEEAAEPCAELPL